MIFGLHITKFSITFQRCAFSSHNPEPLSSPGRGFAPCLPPTVSRYHSASLSPLGCEVEPAPRSLDGSSLLCSQALGWSTETGNHGQGPVLRGAVLARGPRAVHPTTESSPLPTSSPGHPEGHVAVSSQAARAEGGRQPRACRVSAWAPRVEVEVWAGSQGVNVAP